MKLIYMILLALTPTVTLLAQNRFEKEIRAFELLDQQHPPIPGAMLFVGSSSIRMWSTLEQDFSGTPVLNRGFGGSQTSDVLYYFDRVVKPYQPSKIVLYEGDNDLASGKTPGQILEDFKALVDMTKAEFPGVPIAFISIKPSPARMHLIGKMRNANQLVSEYCDGDEGLTFVDVFSPMLDVRGKPISTLFKADSLHMSAEGYGIWKDQLINFVSP